MGPSSAVVFGIVLAAVTLRRALANQEKWKQLMADAEGDNWFKTFLAGGTIEEIEARTEREKEREKEIEKNGDHWGEQGPAPLRGKIPSETTWQPQGNGENDMSVLSVHNPYNMSAQTGWGSHKTVCKNPTKLKGNAHAYLRKLLSLMYKGKEVEYFTQMVAFAADPATYNQSELAYNKPTSPQGAGNKIQLAGVACCVGDVPIAIDRDGFSAMYPFGSSNQALDMIDHHSYKAQLMVWMDSFGVQNYGNPNLSPLIRPCFQDLQCKSFMDWWMFNTAKAPTGFLFSYLLLTLVFPVQRLDFLDTEVNGTAEQKKIVRRKFEERCVEMQKKTGFGYSTLDDYLELLAKTCQHDEVCAAMIGVAFKKEVCRASPWPASDAIKDNDTFTWGSLGDTIRQAPGAHLGELPLDAMAKKPICPFLRTNGLDGPYRCSKYMLRVNKIGLTDKHMELIWENCPKTCPQVVERIAWCQKRYTNAWPLAPQHAYSCGRNSSGQACPTETCFSHLTGQCLSKTSLPYKVCTHPFHSWCPADAADKVYNNTWYLAAQVAIARADSAFLKSVSTTTVPTTTVVAIPGPTTTVVAIANNSTNTGVVATASYSEPKASATAGVALALVVWLF